MQSHRTQTLALALTVPLILGVLVVSTAASIDFSANRQPNLAEGWQSGSDYNLDKITGYIGAFGDFNSDKYTDILAVVQGGTAVQVYLWDDGDKTFHAGSLVQLEEGVNITMIAGGDFDYNGALDVLVGYRRITDPPDMVRLRIYRGNHNEFDTAAPNVVELSPPATGHPTVLDANNDLHLDLFGMANGTRTFWILSSLSSDSSSYQVQQQAVPSGHAGPLWPLTRPHSSALVDFDGDCLADLFVSSVNCTADEVEQGTCPDTAERQFEFWINGNGGFALDPARTQTAPLGAGQVSFADFNGDGTMDLVFPVCYPPGTCSLNNSIQVVYNQQKPMCPLLGSQTNCRPSSALCVSDGSWALDVDPSNSGLAEAVVVPTSSFGARRFQAGFDGMPLTLRVGDYNLDGFPDLLIPTVSAAGGYTVELWQNVPCSASTCSSDAQAAGARTFQQLTDGAESLSSIRDAFAAAFFDIDDDGTLDILVLHDVSLQAAPALSAADSAEPTTTTLAFNGSASTGRYVSAVVNGYESDAFFMKTLSSNGVCPMNCDPPLPAYPSPKPYGVNLPGASWKYTISDWSGTKHVVQGVQMPQSAYLPLHTPYLLFGLGRTSNYLEELYLGVTVTGTHSHLWSGIIPNAQVIAFPYEPDKPDDWYLELWVKTSGLALWVAVGLACCLVVSGAAVLFFRWREKRQDVLEKQERAHLYHFEGF